MIATVWAILGLLLIVSEFVVPQFVVFFFGAGALLNSLLVAVIAPLRSHIPLQIALWLVTSGFSLAFLRRYASRWFRGESFHADNSAITGKTATVIETIGDETPGRVRFGGTTWQASSLEGPIRKGTTVTILQKDGLSLIVTAEELLSDSRND